MSELIFSELKQKNLSAEYAILSEAKKYKINKEITAKQKQTHTWVHADVYSERLGGVWFYTHAAQLMIYFILRFRVLLIISAPVYNDTQHTQYRYRRRFRVHPGSASGNDQCSKFRWIERSSLYH